MSKKKTAYDRIVALQQVNPKPEILRTALRHFTNDQLIRECQKRNILRSFPLFYEDGNAINANEAISRFDDQTLKDEWIRRGFYESQETFAATLQDAINHNDWGIIRKLVADLTP